MDSLDTREQLNLIDRILQETDQRFHVGGELYVAWGTSSALIEILTQAIKDGRLRPEWIGLAIVAVIGSIGFSVVRTIAYRRRAQSMTFMQREYLNVLWLSFALAAVACYGANAIFSGWAQAAVWNLAASFVLFYIGLHHNRAALVGGIVSVVALVVANFTPSISGYVLAAGMIFGYVAFGVSALMQRV